MKFRPFEEIFEVPLKNGLTKPKGIRGEGVKMVNMGELFSYSQIIDIPMDRVPLSEKENNEFLLKPGDLLFARQSLVRDGAGQCSIFLEDNEDVCFESHLIRCRLDKEKANPLYYFYYFRSRTGKLAIDAIIEQGAGAAGIRGSDLKNIFVPDVDKVIQDEVASKINSLDKKIHLNTRINQTLESMAQAIFKSWFVDFDPVKAKIAAIEAGEDPESVNRAAMRAISGKSDDELDKIQAEQPDDYAQLEDTAELFPAAMWDSELGEVPEGWGVSIIGDEVQVVGGGTPSTKNSDFWEGGEIHWTTPKDLSNLTDKVLLTTERKITEAGLKKVSSGLLPINTVLMSSRAPVGYLALAKVPVAVNQGYIAMVCEQRLSPEFVIQWCNSVMTDIKQRSSGTTFAEISKKNFKIIPVLVPSQEILQYYSKLVSGFYDKITEITIESLALVNIRDTLLPKLLSGELSVENIELSET